MITNGTVLLIFEFVLVIYDHIVFIGTKCQFKESFIKFVLRKCVKYTGWI